MDSTSSSKSVRCKKLDTIDLPNNGELLQLCWCLTETDPCVLGKGSYGVVKRGYWITKSLIDVAVKVIISTNILKYEYEIEILANVSHDNIVKFHFEMAGYGLNQ